MKKTYSKPSIKAYTVKATSIIAASQIIVTEQGGPSKSKDSFFDSFGGDDFFYDEDF